MRSTAERRLQAQQAANTRWSREDPRDPDGPLARARAAADARFEREVDPDGVLPEQERRRRAACARRAHYQRMALLSAKARRAKASRDMPATVPVAPAPSTPDTGVGRCMAGSDGGSR